MQSVYTIGSAGRQVFTLLSISRYRSHCVRNSIARALYPFRAKGGLGGAPINKHINHHPKCTALGSVLFSGIIRLWEVNAESAVTHIL